MARIRGRTSAVVVVLGDLGRSPRMQFHSLSLAEQADMARVYVVAYPGTAPHASVTRNPKIETVLLPPFASLGALGALVPRPLLLAAKACLQAAALLWALIWRVGGADFMLVQNPPSIPTFAVCQVASKLRGSQLVIDWHNFGYTLLALSMREGHPFVRLAERYERFFARRASFASHHLCVTRAMKRELEVNWGVRKAHVLYDRAPHFFQPLASREERRAISDRLLGALDPPSSSASSSASSSDSGDSQRPALVVSSTSWTPDEDFSILLEAAERYDAMTKGLRSYPKLLFVITGKGPLREFYREKMDRMQFEKVGFKLMWLAAEDYPRLVSAADLGVSLHVSSSGFDLPMKVVDMFGCGVPVCSANYSCVEELVQHDRNGMLFNDSEELASQLKALFHNFNGEQENSRLEKLRQGALAASERRWADEWGKVATGIFAADKKNM